MAAYVRPYVIALLSDFGPEDPYVGCMKGAILRINPTVQIVDVCHSIAAHHIESAAFILGAVYNDFPDKTIFVCVVDPEVGSDRPIIIASVGRYYFIAPDNGLLTPILSHPELGVVIQATQDHFFNPSPSRTFHGRDIMAPLAGWITKNVAIENMGEMYEDYKKLDLPQPKVLGGALVQGRIAHIDRFGNCITNISRREVDEFAAAGRKFSRLVAKGQEVRVFCDYYAQAPDGGAPVCLFGSLGYLEIACNRGSACAALALSVGSEVGLVFD